MVRVEIHCQVTEAHFRLSMIRVLMRQSNWFQTLNLKPVLRKTTTWKIKIVGHFQIPTPKTFCFSRIRGCVVENVCYDCCVRSCSIPSGGLPSKHDECKKCKATTEDIIKLNTLKRTMNTLLLLSIESQNKRNTQIITVFIIFCTIT